MNDPVKASKIVTTDNTLKVDPTVTLVDVTEGMIEGLQKLVAEREASAFEPVRLDPGPPPVMLTLGDLQEHEKAQSNALQQMESIFRQAGEDQDRISTDLRGDLIAERKLKIKTEAMDKIRVFFAPMAERAKTAAATREFFERSAVLRRARFDKSDQVNHAITASWVARLSAAPALALTGFARDAVATENAALAALVIENVHGREASVSDPVRHDAVRHQVEAVISTLKLPDAEDGSKLIQSIIDTKSRAESAMRFFQTGRPDAAGKIAMGLRARGD
jgi:hypothetical protein